MRATLRPDGSVVVEDASPEELRAVLAELGVPTVKPAAPRRRWRSTEAPVLAACRSFGAGGATTTTIAQKAGVGRPTAYSALVALMRRGVVRRQPAGSGFRPVAWWTLVEGGKP